MSLPELRYAIVQKAEFRGITPAEAVHEFRANEARYRKLWQIRLDPQMAELPAFDPIYREVWRTIRQTGLSGK